jgi:hypothetical protein
MNEDLLSRLVCSKFLYLRGRETLERPSPFHQGIAVVAFHDAVELCLRVVAELIGARVSEQMLFHTLIEKIDEVGELHVPNRSELNQLNRLRNNFKHMALSPSGGDARKAARNVEEFLITMLEKFTDVRFEQLSLAQLVRKIRVRSRLFRAEKLVENGEHESSIENSAVALEVFLETWRARSYRGDLSGQVRRSGPRNTRSGGEIPQSVILLADKSDDEFKKVWERLDLMATGIDLVAYKRFMGYAPVVHLSRAGTAWINGRYWKTPPTYEQARFCYDFVMQSILQMQDHTEVEAQSADSSPEPDLVVTRTAPIIVFPDMHNPIEEIVVVDRWTKLKGSGAKSHSPNFVAIVFDGEIAFIAADAVKSADQET